MPWRNRTKLDNTQELQQIKTVSALEDTATWKKPRLFTVEPQMLLRETICKTRVFFHKTLRNFKSFFFGGYQRLPRSLSFNPFLGRSGNARTYTSYQFYNEFYDQLQSDLNRIKRVNNNSMTRPMEPAMENAASAGSLTSFDKQSPRKSVHENTVKETKNNGSSQFGKEEDSNSQNMNDGTHVLAQKMKELDMMDSGDVEHVLDVEEALHYYSRLTSPVYIDIVDTFFMDMHSEFSDPQSSVSIKRSNSKGRLGPIRL